MPLTSDRPIARGQLRAQLVRTRTEALARGALHRIETRQRIIEDDGIPFVVRIAENLQRKAEDRLSQGSKPAEFDPFAPPEPPLTVGAIAQGHIAVLNKYNVVDQHLLIVTRHYEPQEALLTPADFEALGWCLREIDGLGFYNGGAEAGASQHHKHLQLIPRSLSPGQAGLPLEAVLPETLPPEPSGLDCLPFPHRIAALPDRLFEDTTAAAGHCHPLYRKMLGELDIGTEMRDDMECQSSPYNLLLTRRWMMLVPRTREHFETISINAMGFAGSLFVMDDEDLARVVNSGPMRMLKAVSGSR